MTEIEDSAIALVAKTVAEVPQQRAMLAAIVRIAGNAYAIMTSHGDAEELHRVQARRHQEQGSRGKR